VSFDDRDEHVVIGKDVPLAVHTAEDARVRVASISITTGSAASWFAAEYLDPTRGVMFPGRAGGSAASYDWRGSPFVGIVRDPVDVSVRYERALVALEVCERRAGASCGAPGGVGDGRDAEGLTTCALRIMRTVVGDSGDTKALGQFFVVYAHGNACDAGDCATEATKLAVGLKAHVIVPEFPGYGVVEGVAHEQSVNAILKATVKYCVKFLHAPQSRIIVLGRSIGTGPAAWLARTMSVQDGPPAALVLHSPFTSIRAIARRYVGVASALLPERWNTAANIVDVDCPVLLIHGDMDNIIPHSHSLELVDIVKKTNVAREKEATDRQLQVPDPKPASMSLYVQAGCDHNVFDTEQDFVFPIMKFVNTKVVPYVWRQSVKRQTVIRKGSSTGATGIGTSEKPPEELEPMQCKVRVEASMLKRVRQNTGDADHYGTKAVPLS